MLLYIQYIVLQFPHMLTQSGGSSFSNIAKVTFMLVEPCFKLTSSEANVIFSFLFPQ